MTAWISLTTRVAVARLGRPSCGTPPAACAASAAHPRPARAAPDTHLLMSVGSTVEWMIVLPSGIAIANGDSVKLQPMPKIRSALRRKCGTVFGCALPPEPRARRMGLIEGALARQAGAHRDGEQLGQLAAAPDRLRPSERPGRHRSPAARRASARRLPCVTASGSGPGARREWRACRREAREPRPRRRRRESPRRPAAAGRCAAA